MQRHSAEPVIEVNGLTRTFRVGRGAAKQTIEAVAGISFTVEPGERLAFIGPNGAGKSTSIKMLTGILHPTSGHATVLGMVPWQSRIELAGRIGAVFGQRSQLWHELAPMATYRMLASVYGLDKSAMQRRVDELGQQLDAADLFKQPTRTLSLGQRMRCELAACLLHEPSLLFLDEPSIGLDLVAKQQFRQLLVDVNEQIGCTIFLTSHDVSDIEQVAKRAIVVNHGSIIYDDSVDAMRRTLLRTKQLEVSFEQPMEGRLDRLTDLSPAGESAVAVLRRTATSAVLEINTSRFSIQDVLDLLLAGPTESNGLSQNRLVDLTIVDPPLEHVIGEIYQRPRR